MTYEAHPLADYYPMMEQEEFEELVSDIKEKGQILPIVIFDGKILDGRNRYKACLEAGVEPLVTEYKGTDPVGFALSINELRRETTEDQKSIVCATYYQDILVPLLDSRVPGIPDFEKVTKIFGVAPSKAVLAHKILESCETLKPHSDEAGNVWKAIRDGRVSLVDAENACRTYAVTFKEYTAIHDGSIIKEKKEPTTPGEIDETKAKESAYRVVKKYLAAAHDGLYKAQEVVDKKELFDEDLTKVKDQLQEIADLLYEFQDNVSWEA